MSSIGGYFKIFKKSSPKAKPVAITGWFKNVVLSSGLNRAFERDEYFLWLMKVGTGSSTPSISNTQLDNTLTSHYGSQIAGGTGVDADGPYSYLRFQYTFDQGQVVGNITELGPGGDWSDTVLWARSLIKDANGNPISLSLISTDILIVVYELRNYQSITPTAPFQYVLNGVTHTFVTKPVFTSNPDWNRAPTNGFWVPREFNEYKAFACSGAVSNDTALGPSGTYAPAYNVVHDAYVQNSYQRSFTLKFGLSDANFGASGINSFVVKTTAGAFQTSVTPPIMKNNLQTLDIKFNMVVGIKQ